MAANEHFTPRINAARAPQYVNSGHVRLVCKLDRFIETDRARVEAADGGEMFVVSKGKTFGSTFVEVVGPLVDANTIKAEMIQSLGDELDMKLVNDVIELSHDPRFKSVFSPGD